MSNDEEKSEKKKGPWDSFRKKHVGQVIERRVTPNGTYINEPIVQVFCDICTAEFIGPAREAGGFLGGHECLHVWQLKQQQGEDNGLTA